ncbi:cAMP-binding protein - catabolite gene activator and regulatory subunit of cAMP-dependent protein kinase [Thermogutta terrifontis]|uniref:cAMP-binding protein - catabolite gene activator and regulatory subunit of cAMP-dependent protein kinase n=1 Tax=Thermogutta terrifontis TaxID=1331910 RepID=A0A286RCI9_9BACT|nr:cyclic nucleotide-binding domain-containing protein [Thermogutta terrifontis]ASV73627.1 cAMP-binding protein - catabolite gene activator and regulatory subunit of cAMP-dependent protein kinase [Thermogutta terrifontis]
MVSPEMLRRYPYFAKISEESLKEIAMMAEERSYPAGLQLFNEGDPADYLNIIVEGEVQIQYQLGNGEKRTVDTLVPGDILVWSALIEPYRTTAIGTTSKPTKVIAIKAKPLRELCDRDPMVGYQLTREIAKLLAHRLESARVQLAAA